MAEPQKSDILSASARKLTMSDACESSSSCEEEEEPEGMMDLSPQSCCQQESLLLHYIFFSQVFSHHLHILKLSL